MIKVILGLSVTIAVLIGISVLIIRSLRKKNKSLSFKLEFSEAQNAQMRENKLSYEKTISELKEIRSKYDKLRTKIVNSTGSDLSATLNGL